LIGQWALARKQTSALGRKQSSAGRAHAAPVAEGERLGGDGTKPRRPLRELELLRWMVFGGRGHRCSSV
jgi:hypothetical protein